MIRHTPERDISEQYLTRARAWVAEHGEILVVLRYLGMAGAKDFALCRSEDEFIQLIDWLPAGTDIEVLRGKYLPLRGVITSDFANLAFAEVPDGTEYLLLTTQRQRESAISIRYAWSDSHSDLREDLEEWLGIEVAFGICPDFMASDGVNLISASKGGIDGPR